MGRRRLDAYLSERSSLIRATSRAPLALAFLSPGREQDRLTQDAVFNDPLCADSWSMRSEVLWRLGQSHAAREAVDRALRINPANGSAQITRDEQLMNEGQWTRVIRPLENVEFEFAKSRFLRGMLGNQCRARLLAEQDAEDACNRWFATSGSEASWCMRCSDGPEQNQMRRYALGPDSRNVILGIRLSPTARNSPTQRTTRNCISLSWTRSCSPLW